MGKEDRFVYLGDTPYSATFYSNNTAGTVELSGLSTVAPHADTTLFLAVPKGMRPAFTAALRHPLDPLYESQRYLLFRVEPQDIAG
jgi:hypothetical protein